MTIHWQSYRLHARVHLYGTYLYLFTWVPQKFLASLDNFIYKLNLLPQLKRRLIGIHIDIDKVLMKSMWSIEKQALRKGATWVLLQMILCTAHTSGDAMSVATECGYESLLHPPHLLDLAPSDFCLFPLTKEHLRGTQFSSDNDIIASVKDSFRYKNRQMNSSTRLEYWSCRNCVISALKLAEIT